ncbi:orotidine-5'-phosphate decarboxylase [Entomomonas asaccharolytica]|uniref:Orotidine 5'-phosphate decarboxylase n=1 Tax=Entomomonas asaccharolytica TaxID=2785331 RepID=A0A974RVU4_9GAMM|nr:orotidine-5'-phosphate decarboxylase [Entomomonas asaccharolytica]QQP84412.1 orotidine-5'-phosphate decarboxylase [Entomomonas asaccharolytica]
MSCTSPVIVALDFSTVEDAINLAKQLDPTKCRVKIGKELFTVTGPKIVEELQKIGFEVFLDLKFHDIPNTTAMAVKVAASMGVWMVDIHCVGGLAMMQACRNVLDQMNSKTLLIGVTVLTSLGLEDLQQLSITKTPEQQVLSLAQLAAEARLDGLVSSAQEARALKLNFPQLKLVTPGIRPVGASKHDQQRIVTPAQAMLDGSDYLVIGRPITKAVNPPQALEDILISLQ